MRVKGAQLAPRYVVTNLARSPKRIYEFYCRRGDQENRIKEMKLDLASGRTSCHRFQGWESKNGSRKPAG